MTDQDGYDVGYDEGYRDAHMEFAGGKQAQKKEVEDLKISLNELREKLVIFQQDNISLGDFSKLRNHRSNN